MITAPLVCICIISTIQHVAGLEWPGKLQWDIQHYMQEARLNLRQNEKLRSLRKLVVDAATKSHSLDGTMKVSQIPRVKAADLSFSDFYNNYAVARKPVIITNSTVFPGDAPKYVDFREGGCGKARLLPLVYNKNKALPGHLQALRDQEMSLSSYLALHGDKPRAGTELDSSFQVANYNILKRCRELLNGADFHIPKYFAQDFFQRIGTDAVRPPTVRDQYPSLHIAPTGTRVGLRSNSYRLHEWKYQVDGQNYFRLFSPDQRHLLTPTPKFTYQVDPIRPNYGLFPLARQLEAFDGTTYPGDVLFLPHGWIQYAEAQGTTDCKASVMLSFAYVDQSNYNASLLGLLEGLDTKNINIHNALSHEKFPRDMTMDPRDLSLAEYKSGVGTLPADSGDLEEDALFEAGEEMKFSEDQFAFPNIVNDNLTDIIEKGSKGHTIYILITEDGDHPLNLHFWIALNKKVGENEAMYRSYPDGVDNQAVWEYFMVWSSPSMVVIKNNTFLTLNTNDLLDQRYDDWQSQTITATSDMFQWTPMSGFGYQYARFVDWYHFLVSENGVLGQMYEQDETGLKDQWEVLMHEIEVWQTDPSPYLVLLVIAVGVAWAFDAVVDLFSGWWRKGKSKKEQRAHKGKSKSGKMD